MPYRGTLHKRTGEPGTIPLNVLTFVRLPLEQRTVPAVGAPALAG